MIVIKLFNFEDGTTSFMTLEQFQFAFNRDELNQCDLEINFIENENDIGDQNNV